MEAEQMGPVLEDEEGHYGNGVQNLRDFAQSKVFTNFSRSISTCCP
jgi:hypothetical protein